LKSTTNSYAQTVLCASHYREQNFKNLNNLILSNCTSQNDSIIIGDMLSSIWNDNLKSSDLEIIFKHIKLFPRGHIIARIGDINVGSSIAFPINEKPSIEIFNKKHPYDFISLKGKLYYIHVIQVLPEFRNEGIGTKVLEKQIEVAKDIKCKNVVGYSIENEINRWERKGFKSYGKISEYKNFGKVKWIELPL
jgi:GNAT superfamily N-acetyltransferase